MRRVLFLLSVYVSTLNLVFAQVVLKTENQVLGFTDLPSESTFVHTNASFLLTGEYLYYKVFCFEGEESELTKLSKIAYVELVGKDMNPIFKHKISLKNGVGQGDFFIPTDIVSGNYKLIAYTNWMLNEGLKDFHQSDITIINPYRSNQPELLKSNNLRTDSLNTIEPDTLLKAVLAPKNIDDFGSLQIKLNGERFAKRQKVSFVLKGLSSSQIRPGNYSISVRKKDLISEPFPNDGFDLVGKKGESKKKNNIRVGDTIVLPELRGELYQGSVVALQNDKSVRNLKVAVSIPGEDYVLDVVRTDVLGNFQVNVMKAYSGEKILVQVLNQNPEAFRIVKRQPKAIDYAALDFKEVKIDLAAREEILRRSIHNQIENSFFQFRPDSILNVSPELFFDDKEKKIYLLDDYTLFRTLRETFVEIIQDVSSIRIGKDNFAIRVKGYDYASIRDIAPLIVLDGCVIQDHNALLDFDARYIEDITVFRHSFLVGPELYEGAIIIKTETGEGYTSFQYEGAISTFNVLRPQPDKKYFVQWYDKRSNEQNRRLPDDRVQLLWMPKLKLTENEFKIDFYTSDVVGEFEIHIMGITADKNPVSIRKSIFVN